MRKKCYIYTRVSTAAQTEGYSLEAQSERLRKYADYKEMEVVREYCDAGKSGKSITGRPEFQRMLQDVSEDVTKWHLFWCLSCHVLEEMQQMF